METALKIIPIKIVDRNKTARRWFYGSADFQRAKNACKDNESVYPVEIEFPGQFSNRVESGWAVGN